MPRPRQREDPEVAHPAPIALHAAGESADRLPSLRGKQPQRGIVARDTRVLLGPAVERLRVVVPVVGERLVEDRVDGWEVVGGLDPGDLDPLRRRARLERSDEVDLHVPEVAHQSQVSSLEQRLRGMVACVDHKAKPG